MGRAVLCCAQSWLTKGVHTVKFRIDADHADRYIYIGVVGRGFAGYNDRGSGYIGYDGHSWGWSPSGMGGTPTLYPAGNNWGRAWNTGDIVTMVVDMDKHTLAFGIGEEVCKHAAHSPSVPMHTSANLTACLSVCVSAWHGGGQSPAVATHGLQAEVAAAVSTYSVGDSVTIVSSTGPSDGIKIDKDGDAAAQQEIGRNCPSCGTFNPPGVHNCNDCGEYVAPAYAAAPAAEEKKKKKKKPLRK
jgi:hypothetical protein